MGVCDICVQPLELADREGICSGCRRAGQAWAHRQLIRLWNQGLDRVAISRELGYTQSEGGLDA